MASPRRIGIDFPPVKDHDELHSQQRAAVAPDEIRRGMSDDIPPVVRSVLELAHLLVSAHSQKLRAAPGYQGGLIYRGRPFCFASGYRDGTRPRDMEDKGNHMRLKDPLTYGALTLPVTAAFLCELHSRGEFDLTAPLTTFLPELDGVMDSHVTARSVLSFVPVVDDARVLRDAGARPLRPLFARNMCAAAQRDVFRPLNSYFSGASPAPLSGSQQREHFVQYLRTARPFAVRSRRFPPSWRGRVSHFTVALLAAAVERQLRGESFEAAARRIFFEPAQCHGAGFGPPKLWRDPNEMFYQPSGLALQHEGFARPLPAGAAENCGPPLLNASMNLYAPAEDYGKLLLLSVDAICGAREVLGTKDNATGFDFGVEWTSGGSSAQLTRRVSGIDWIPSAASFRYDTTHDLGCFGVCNSGTRNASFLANVISRMIQHLFVRHVIRNGVDAEAGPDLDNPTKTQSETEEKFRKVVKAQEYTTYFKKHDAHKRF